MKGFTTLGTSYQYDQLQRLKQATSFEMATTVNDWQGIAATQKYFNSYSYDPNGNITNLVRKDQSGALMDQFTCFAVYTVRLQTNRIRSFELLALCYHEHLHIKSFKSPIGTVDTAAVDFNPLQVLNGF